MCGPHKVYRPGGQDRVHLSWLDRRRIHSLVLEEDCQDSLCLHSIIAIVYSKVKLFHCSIQRRSNASIEILGNNKT